MKHNAERASNFERYIAKVVVAPVLLLGLLAALLFWQIGALLAATRWLDHTDEVTAQANNTLKLAVDAETGEHGYLATTDPQFLQPYADANRRINADFSRLAQLVAHNPLQSQRAAAMRAQYATWAAQARLEIALRRSDPARFGQEYISEKSLMDTLRSQFRVFLATQDDLRRAREQAVRRQTRLALGGSVVITLACGLVLGLITARQARQLSGRYEEALEKTRQSLDMFATTLMSIGDAVLVTDAHGAVTQMNEVAQNLTGWKIGDAYGRPADDIFRIVSEDTGAPAESPVARVIRDGAVRGLATHTQLVRRNSDRVPIDDSVAPIKDRAGNLLGTVLVFRDITQRRKAEAELSDAYHKERHIAETLQKSLLRKPPTKAFPQLEVQTLYRAASDEAKVGGDFYDLFPLEAGRVALVVGDISGKGLQAAARTAEAKYVLRAYLREHSSPERALSWLNTYLFDTQSGEDLQISFLSAILAILDPASGDGVVCVAGASPPLIVRGGGSAEQVAAGGMPLCIMPDAELDTAAIHLEPGDFLLMVTDGVTEARRKGDFLGTEGLANLAEAARSAQEDLEDIGQALLRGVWDYSGGKLTDDLCMLLARRR